MSSSSSPPNSSNREEPITQNTTSAFISHHVHVPNLALDHAKNIQHLLEGIFQEHRCYGEYTIHAEFDEDTARMGLGLLQVIVITLNAAWCSKKMEYQIGLVAWPFVTELHMKPLPLPRRTTRIAPVAPKPSRPSTDVIASPSPTLIPFLGRNSDAHVPHTRPDTGDDNGIANLPETKHINHTSSFLSGENWHIPIHSSIEGDYAMSLDSQIDMEVVPGAEKRFVHFDSNANMENSWGIEYPCITVTIPFLQLALPRLIDERTDRLVSLSNLPTLITTNIRANVGRVINLNLPQDSHHSLQAISYTVQDSDSTLGTISSVEKTLRPVNVDLMQGHVDICGKSCNAELDWCYNLAKPCRMHSITMNDPAHATFVLCGSKLDDWPSFDLDFVTVWRLQNERSGMSKYFSSSPCARAKEPINVYSHVAHRVSMQIDLEGIMHDRPAVTGNPTNAGNNYNTTLEPLPSKVPGSDANHSIPISRAASSQNENGRPSDLRLMFRHALKGRIQRKKLKDNAQPKFRGGEQVTS